MTSSTPLMPRLSPRRRSIKRPPHLDTSPNQRAEFPSTINYMHLLHLLPHSEHPLTLFVGYGWSSYENSTYKSPSPRRAFHTTPRLRASFRLRMGFAVSRSHPTRDPASLTTSTSSHPYKLRSQAGFRHVHTPRDVRLSRSFPPLQQSKRNRVCSRHSHSPITR